MTTFNPGDKVIKRTETDPKNYGEVMDLLPVQMKEGYVAVYFKRHVWIKPENLMHFDEWKQQRRAPKPVPANLRQYWNGAR